MRIPLLSDQDPIGFTPPKVVTIDDESDAKKIIVGNDASTNYSLFGNLLPELAGLIIVGKFVLFNILWPLNRLHY
jgi:hypothetical protein